MSDSRRTIVLARHTWLTARRRRLAFLVPAILGLLCLAQLPRFLGVHAAFAAGDRSRALGDWVELIGSIYGGCVVAGTVLALALGAAATGSRKMRAHLVPLLARPVARREVVVARWLGNAALLVAFWLVPALAFEAIRHLVGAPVGLPAGAFFAPLLLHLLSLATGMALGSVLAAIPATFSGLGLVWAFLLVAENRQPEGVWLGRACAAATWIVPPFRELLSACAPFASGEWGARCLVLAQTSAWIAALLVFSTWRYEGLDFSVRDE